MVSSRASVQLLLVVFISITVVDAQLSFDFYKGTKCSNVEKIVRRVVVKALKNNTSLAGGILRLHFHDCFVRGCDGSILINSTPTNQAEKDHPANNPSLRGFDVIEAAKAALGSQCRDVVSCADILAFAARDSVVYRAGPFWKVRAGRRDGNVSLFADAPANLPAPFFNVTQLLQNFGAKNLSLVDMVALSGAHTIGLAHCSSVTPRLFGFSNTTAQDPSLNQAFATTLKSQCPNSNATANRTLGMDSSTPVVFDSNYFNDVQQGRGLFISDAALTTTSATSALVGSYNSNQTLFFSQFVASMIKMSEIEVKTGNQGEIRKVCGIVN